MSYLINEPVEFSTVQNSKKGWTVGTAIDPTTSDISWFVQNSERTTTLKCKCRVEAHCEWYFKVNPDEK